MNLDIIALKPIIVDAIVVAIMLTSAIAHGKKGLYNEVMPFVIFIFAVIIGVFSSRVLAPIVAPYTNTFIEEKIIGSYKETGLKIIDSFAEDFINQEMSVLCEKITQIALFIVCTLVAWLLLAIIKSAFGALADWFAIGWINHSLGFILGFAEAFLAILLLIRLSSLLNINVLSDLSKDTIVFKWIYGVDLKELINKIKDLNISLTESFEAIKK